MKIFSNLLIICLFCHTRAFLYPGLEPFKTNPKDVYKDKLDDQQKDKANFDEVEMDWNAVNIAFRNSCNHSRPQNIVALSKIGYFFNFFAYFLL